MGNDVLMLLFQAGVFLVALLTFIVLLIEKLQFPLFTFDNISPTRNWIATIFNLILNSDASCLSN